MIRKLLTVLALIPSVAHAQVVQDGFVRPVDVPAYEESYDGYAAGTTENQLGDGSTAWGGTMPVLSEQPADIPSTATGWRATGVSFKDEAGGAVEAKFRSVADFSHMAPDDPIRNYAQPASSHLHCFFGSTTVNAFSTYGSLRGQAVNFSTNTYRKQAASTIAGGPENATGYWFPCLIKTNPFGNGKNYAVKPDGFVVYYVHSLTDAGERTRLPRGLRYILGTDMDDPDGALRNAEIAAANAQPGTSGRYSKGTAHGPDNDGWVGWECRTGAGALVTTTGGQTYSNHLKSTAGVDPWGGNCTAGMTMNAHLVAPQCYDGENLWSPGGYKHFRYAIQDSVHGSACPNGWYKVSQLNITIKFRHQGFADYGTWRAASDDMMEAKLTSLGTPRTVANGESMHTDWLGGWDDTVFFGNEAGTVLGWQKFCAGVNGNTPRECDSSTFNSTHHLVGGYAGENAPDLTRTPQVDQSEAYNTSNPADMLEIPSNWTGPHTFHGP